MGFGSISSEGPGAALRGLRVGCRLDKAKSMFFDRRAVQEACDRGTRQVLSKFGAYVRTSAKSSIRRRKKASEPGHPPSSHTGLLKKFIFFGYDTVAKSVVIGPTLLARRSGEAPEALEYGGYVRSRLARKIHRRIGSGGEIRFDGPTCRTTKRNRFGANVTYIKIRTQSQADRANQLQSQLYDSAGMVQIAARPYMHPAFDLNKSKLPALWANSIK
jgi:hypothetical protein